MVLLFLADGFEEIEALTPVDMLRRVGVELLTVGIGKKTLVGAHGIAVEADMIDSEVTLSMEPEMVILPGGMPGAKNLDESPVVSRVLDYAYCRGAVIGAICAAPMILGKRQMLIGRRATCFPEFEEYLTGAEYIPHEVVVDGNIVTACGMGVALEFSLALISKLKGEEAASELKSAVLAR